MVKISFVNFMYYSLSETLAVGIIKEPFSFSHSSFIIERSLAEERQFCDVDTVSSFKDETFYLKRGETIFWASF